MRTTSPRTDESPDASGATELRYVVPGRPVTWERKRLDGRGRKVRTFTSDEQERAMAAHQWHAVAALGPRRAEWALTGAFEIGVMGYWPDAVVGDVDRLLSLAMDALQGIAYRTDRQVRLLGRTGIVADGSPERVEVVLRRLDVDPVQGKARRSRSAT